MKHDQFTEKSLKNEGYDLKAFAITSEINLNKLAIHCAKKIIWEESFSFKGDIQISILNKEVDES